MTAPTPEPKWFVFSSAPEGTLRAEFLTFDAAVDWACEHGGTLTDSPTNEGPGETDADRRYNEQHRVPFGKEVSADEQVQRWMGGP